MVALALACIGWGSAGSPVSYTPARAASAFAELPLGHWAYSAFARLTESGAAQSTDLVLPKGTAVTRYEMALALARVLLRMESAAQGKSVSATGVLLAGGRKDIDLDKLLREYNATQPSLRRLSAEIQELIRKLATEFSGELDVLGYRVMGAASAAGIQPSAMGGGTSGKASGGSTAAEVLGGGSAPAKVPPTAVTLDSPALRVPAPDGLASTSLGGVAGAVPRTTGGGTPLGTVTLGDLAVRRENQVVVGVADRTVDQIGGIPADATVRRTTQFQLTGRLSPDVVLDAVWKLQSPLGSGSAVGGPFDLSVGALFVGVGSQVVARLGQLPETLFNPLAFDRPESLQGFQAGFQLGQVGSAVVLATRQVPRRDGSGDAAEATEYVTALDGRIQLSDRATLGATWVRTTQRVQADSAGGGAADSSVAGFEGFYILSPSVTVSGSYAQHTDAPVWDEAANAVRVGAEVKVGDVLLGAEYARVAPGFRAPLGKEEPGSRVGLSVKVGDVEVSTQRGETTAQERVETVTSVDVRLDAGSLASIRAGYEYVDLADLARTKLGTRSTTSLDLEGGGEHGRWMFGLTWEDVNAAGGGAAIRPSTVTTTRAGISYQLQPRARATADVRLVNRLVTQETETTTSFGLQYALSPDASILLGYKLIDWTQPGRDDPNRANVATAQFSIRF